MTGLFELQECMVSHVHPSWLVSLSEDLIDHCKKQERGRRWIADFLADWSVLINSLENCDLEEALARDSLHHFWVDPQSKWDSLVVQRLGAMVYASSIIKIVNGEQVRAIAEGLGRRLYADALDFGRNSPASPDDLHDVCRLEKLGLGNQWLLELKLEGFKELCVFALRRHPLLLERVKIAQDKAFSASTPLQLEQGLLQEKLVVDCILYVMRGGADE